LEEIFTGIRPQCPMTQAKSPDIKQRTIYKSLLWWTNFVGWRKHSLFWLSKL